MRTRSSRAQERPRRRISCISGRSYAAERRGGLHLSTPWCRARPCPRANQLAAEPLRLPVLRLDPAALPGSVGGTGALGDDALEAAVAHHLEQRLAVLERRDEPNV